MYHNPVNSGWINKPLKPVTHGPCDARLTVTFPVKGRASPPLDRHQIILLGVRICPRLITWKRKAGRRTF